MKLHVRMMLALTAASCLLLQSGLRADEKKAKEKETPKDVVIEGELTNADVKDKVRTASFCKSYTFKMTEGKSYQIDMKSKDIDSYLRLENPEGTQVAFDDDGGGFPDARITYTAPKTGDYQIFATTFNNGETGKFTLTVKQQAGAEQDKAPAKQAKATELKLDQAKAATYDGELKADDPLYQGRKLHQVFLYPMEAGKTYRIDHSIPTGDAYLYLEDPQGKVVDQNDDNGESLDSRIVYKADKAGAYRIIATSLSGKNTGGFKLTVRVATQEEAKQAQLFKRIQNLFVASNEERKEIADEVCKMVEAKGAKIGLQDAGLAIQVGSILEGSDEKLAAEYYRKLGTALAKAENEKISAAAKSMEGAARRLTLLGNTMEVKGKTLDGKDFDLKNLKGKVVLVDFWATWCGPCVAEIPNVKKMYEKYNKQGFEVIGISIDNSQDQLQKFIEKEKLPWACIYDGEKKDGDGIANYYGVFSIPQAILVGQDGRVISLRARGEELNRLLEKAFDEKR